MSIQSVTYPRYYSDRWNYSLDVNYSHKKVMLVMQAPHALLTTSSLPMTSSLLSQIAPRVLTSRCFNNQKIPFSEEVKHTEIAHLYEHILLEYLCQERINTGKKTACYSGWTTWDWQKEARGLFRVEITGNSVTEEAFTSAFAKSIILLETIFNCHKKITPKQIDFDYLFVKRMHE